MKRIGFAIIATLILAACGAVQTTSDENPDGGQSIDKGDVCSWDHSSWDQCNWAP